MSNFTTTYYKYATKIYKLIQLNILWVIFTLIGFGFFGLMPATTAMFSVTRKWEMEDKDIPIFKTFLETYKKDFLFTNLYGFVFVIVAYLLAVGYVILSSQLNLFYTIGAYILLFWMLIYLVILTYFFPLYVHFKLNFFEYIKMSFLMGISHPITTVTLVFGITILDYFLLDFLPVLLIFFGGSLNAYLINRSVTKIYKKYSPPVNK